MTKPKQIAIVGGGAAGIFAAIASKETDPSAGVTVFDKSRQLLKKVRISGGGRCNVTHHCFEPKTLVQNYPRGRRELLGAFYQWQPQDTIDWFANKGVELKTESDGRMFPTTDDSQTIVDCLLQSARKLDVILKPGVGIQAATKVENGFSLIDTNGGEITCDQLILASGGSRSQNHYDLATAFGHTLVPTVPSLFSFHISDARIQDLQGLSVAAATVSDPQQKLSFTGPLLITHEGLSGPAILKLSAFGARSFHDADYQFEISLNWLGGTSREQSLELLKRAKAEQPRKLVQNACPFPLPSRLWKSLASFSQISPQTQWSQVSKTSLQTLATELCAGKFKVNGKSMNKEEFVTAGGIALKEVDFKSMESKLVKGLRFAGEFLDIDGVTGGFNFQAAWTTGRIAGSSAVQSP